MRGMPSLRFLMPTTSLAGRGLWGCPLSLSVPPFSFSRSLRREIPGGCAEAAPARLHRSQSPWPRLPPCVAESPCDEGGAVTRLGIKRLESLDAARRRGPAWTGLGRLRAGMIRDAKPAPDSTSLRTSGVRYDSCGHLTTPAPAAPHGRCVPYARWRTTVPCDRVPSRRDGRVTARRRPADPAPARPARSRGAERANRSLRE